MMMAVTSIGQDQDQDQAQDQGKGKVKVKGRSLGPRYRQSCSSGYPSLSRREQTPTGPALSTPTETQPSPPSSGVLQGCSQEQPADPDNVRASDTRQFCQR